MPERLDRIAVVTGGSGEIGGYLVAHLMQSGWNVLSVDRVPPGSDVPPPSDAVSTDLSDGPAAIEALDRLYARHGAPDVLINCAGLIANAPLVTRAADGWHMHDFGLWDQVVGSGLTAAFHATAVSVRHMLQARKKGVVVNVSSICAKGNPGQAAYSAAKAGLNGLTLALAKEIGPLGIRVVGIAPGYFDTRSTARNVAEARLSRIVASVPLRRLGHVDEIARAIDFVVANEYINGTILELDGGLVV